jgi:hypothetical protein
MLMLLALCTLLGLQDASAQLRTSTFKFGDVEIRIREGYIIDTIREIPQYIHSHINTHYADVYDTIPAYTDTERTCKASFEVRRGSKTIYSRRYDTVEALGGWAGLYLPKKQPLSDLFIVIKEGDYDGRLFLVERNGKVFNLPGGMTIFIAPDTSFLVSDYSTDGPGGLTVFDLRKRKVIATSLADGLSGVVACYSRNSELVFESSNDDGNPQYASWNWTSKRFKDLTTFNPKNYSRMNAVETPDGDTSADGFENCNCHSKRQ